MTNSITSPEQRLKGLDTNLITNEKVLRNIGAVASVASVGVVAGGADGGQYVRCSGS